GEELEEEPLLGPTLPLGVDGERVEERAKLLLRECLRLLLLAFLDPLSYAEARRWVRADHTFLERSGEQRPHRRECVATPSRRKAPAGEHRCVAFHVPRLDRRELHPPEKRDGAIADRVAVRVEAKVASIVRDRLRPDAARGSACVGRDPLSCELG